MSLKNKIVNSFSWSMLEGLAVQALTFIVGVFLARLLPPSDFGIVGLTTVFIAISTTIVGAGFSEALIRKVDISDKDYNTVFYSNIIVSFFLYVILFLSSSYIAIFFEEPILEVVVKFVAFTVIISAFSLVQKSILTKELNFKLQALISIFSAIISGAISIYMALSGFGIWSLIALNIIRQSINCILLWFFNKWRPKLIFSRKSFSELFDYGYKLLIANLINTIYGNFFYVIIGKVYSPISLGYYSRADAFQRPFSANIALGIRRISFPVLSTLQHDKVNLKDKFIKFLRMNSILSCIVMFFILGTAKPMILLLIGEKWYPSIFYTQLLCIPGLLYGLQILNLNLLIVLGYSNLNLKLEVVKKLILIPLVFIASFYGIDILLYVFVAFSIIEYFINSYYTNKLINYPIFDQIKNISVFFIIGIGSLVVIYPLQYLFSDLYKVFFCQILVYVIYYTVIIFTFSIPEYELLRDFLKKTIKFKK